MRIVHFTGAFLPNIGGAEAVVHNLALEQARAGHQVYVLNNWTRKKARFRRSVRLPYQLISLPPKINMEGISRRPFMWKVLSAWLRHLKRKYRFDIWHLHYAYPIGSALPLLVDMGIDPVLTCHGIDIVTVPSINFGLRLNPEIDREITSILRQCRKLTAMSGEIHQKYIEAGCDARHIFDIPNGVSFDYMNSISRETAVQAVRDKYGLPRGVSIVLTVGRNVPFKRFDRIPGMIASLAKVRKDFVWVMVGPGCDSLVQACADCGVADYLRVLGPFRVQIQDSHAEISFPSPEMVEMFRASDFFAYPTCMEGMPMVVLEAMAAGLPIASMDVPGVRDLVDSGVNGFLSQDGQAEDMARNISKLLTDPQMRLDMGARGQEKAKDYDWRIVAQKYLELYSHSTTMKE